MVSNSDLPCSSLLKWWRIQGCRRQECGSHVESRAGVSGDDRARVLHALVLHGKWVDLAVTMGLYVDSGGSAKGEGRRGPCGKNLVLSNKYSCLPLLSKRRLRVARTFLLSAVIHLEDLPPGSRRRTASIGPPTSYIIYISTTLETSASLLPASHKVTPRHQTRMRDDIRRSCG